MPRRHRAIELISSSRRADVHLAARIADGVQVVVKRHHDPAGAARERAVLSRVRSPGAVLSLRSAELERSSPWVLLQPLDGLEPLARRVARGRATIVEAIDVALGIARALDPVHAASVVHRGLCPDNVMIAPDLARVVLVGFGNATIEPSSDPAGNAPIRTTPLDFTAPELLVGAAGSVDQRADYFSLGVILYELVTGALPHSARDASEAHRFHAHLALPPPRLDAARADVPPPLAALVARLMSKAPEDRPTSGTALARDLAACRDLVAGLGAPDVVLSSARGASERFRVKPSFEGREDAQERLLDAVARRLDGAPLIAAIEGPSGIGKSALVDAVEPRLRRLGVEIGRGKFDQMQRARPYGALADALRTLTGERLATSGDRHDAIIAELRARLAEDASWLLLAIPESSSIFGDAPPAPRAGSAETHARIAHAVARYVEALTELTGPVALFLDDLQWADHATADVLRAIAAEAGGRVIVLFAYRTPEIERAASALAMIAELERSGVEIARVTLGPLEEREAAALVAHAVEDAPGADALAHVVAGRTGGNPLLVTQFLIALGRDSLIVRDAASGAWTWDLDAVRSFVSSDRVADVIAERLGVLEPSTRRLVARASLFGPSFAIADLALVEGAPVDGVRRALADAVAEGFLAPSSDGRTYRFIHDRIEQAARAPVEAEAPALHAELARKLYDDALVSFEPAGSRTGDSYLVPRLHAVAGHARAGAAHFAGGAEAARFTALLRRAASAAHTSAAFRSAIDDLLAARSLIERTFEGEARGVALLDLHFELAECQLAVGDGAGLEPTLDRLDEAAPTPLDRARALTLRVKLSALHHNHERAIEVALSGLALLGVSLRRAPSKANVVFGLLRTHLRLARTTDAKIEALPEMRDAQAIVAIELISAVMASAYQVADQGLFACCCFAALDLILDHGHTPTTAFDFCTYGMLRIAALDDYRGGQRYSALGLRLAERWADGPTKCRASVVHHLFVHHWTKHWGTAQTAILQAHELGRRAGEMNYAGYAFGHFLDQLTMGRPLDEVDQMMSLGQAFTASMGDHGASVFTVDLRELFDVVRGTKDDLARAAERPREHEELGPTWRYWWFANLLAASVHLDDQALALHALESADALAEAGMCSWTRAVLPAYAAILLTRRWTSGIDRRRSVRRIRASVRKLRRWEATAPDNARAYRVLAEACLARVRRDERRAAELTEEAIEHARAGDHRPILVAAYRFAADLALERGRRSIAATYAGLAVEAAESWGAHGVARRIRARFQLPEPAVAPTTPGRDSRALAPWAEERADLDALTLSIQALSRELGLDRLVAKLMEVVMVTGGATRAYLLRCRDARWTPLAVGHVSESEGHIVVDQLPFEVPVALLRYVAHSGAPLNLDDALADRTFGQDPLIATDRPRSLLLLPISRNGALTAALVLENHHVRGAFRGRRLERLSLLSGQIAISLENAELYGKMERAVATADAASRTKAIFLAGVSHELRTPLNAIYGAIDVMRKAELSPEIAELAGLLDEGSHALSRSLGALLEYTELEAGEVRLEDVALDLPRLVELVCARHRARAEEKGLVLAVTTTAPLLVAGDSLRLARILDHLLDNAVKFTARGTIEVSATVHARARDAVGRSARLELLVADTGEGMTRDALAAAFEPLARPHASGPGGNASGFGVGLAYVRRSVELMAGTVTLDSKPERGTRAHVSIPLRALAEEHPNASPEAPSAKGKRVLAAEDNRVNQIVLAKMVAKLGYEIELCADGRRAFERYAADPSSIVCVLMDCMMPEMDGYESALRIRALERRRDLPRVPIVAVTANVLSFDKDKCLYAGMDDYLPKPIRAALLGEVLARAGGPGAD